MNRISRQEAGLIEPSSEAFRTLGQITEVVFHYSAAEAQKDCKAQWRAIQRYHMGTNGWSDIGYNYGICLLHGHLLVGRGLRRIGAHAPGHNTQGVGVCFLTDDDEAKELTPKAMETAIELVEWLKEKTERELERLGHRDTKATTCPGDEIYAWLRDGMPAPSTSADKPRRRPKRPSRPRKPKACPKGHRKVELCLPLLGAGDRGKDVEVLQRILAVDSDGIFGPQTERAVKNSQRRADIKVDGVVGPDTWAALLT